MRRAAVLSLAPGAQVCTGIAAVDEDGRLCFASPLAGIDMLEQLAGWVHQHVGAHPGLASLCGACFLRTDANGRIHQRYESYALWAGVPRPARRGTLAAVADTLSQLAVGEDAWVWISEGQQRPVAIAAPVVDDPQAQALAGLILAGRRRAGRVDAGLRGTARRLRSGGLLITSGDPLSVLGEEARAWLAEQGEVRLVQVVGGEFVAAERLGGTGGGGCAPQVAALAALARGEDVVFWLTAADRSGAPLLLLEESRAALKALALAADSGAPSMRGQLSVAKWGIELRTRQDISAALPALARWVGRHHKQWPGLRALIGARVTVRAKDGSIIKRTKDNNAWAPLRDARS